MRRKSDLGPIAESERVSTLGVEQAASRSLRRTGKQTPSAAVHHRAGIPSGHHSAVPESQRNGGEDQTFLIPSSTHGEARITSENGNLAANRPHVLTLSDHITCLRQKNLRRHDDVISSSDHVTSNAASEPDGEDDKCISGERYRTHTRLFVLRTHFPDLLC